MDRIAALPSAALNGPARSRWPLLRAIFRATPVIVGVAAATVFISWLGWLERFELAGLDAFNLLQSPRFPTHVLLVAITDDDYRDLFAETSPLDPERLHAVIAAVARGNPSLIAVDIDTSASVFRDFKVPPDWPPVVWGQDCEQVGDTIRPLGVLAGQPLRDIDSSGIAALPQDSDGVIRRYLREFRTEAGPFPALPWEVVRVAARLGLEAFIAASQRQDGHSSQGLRLNFAGERYTFSPLSAQFVVQGSRAEEWGVRGPLTGKVVILGGCYRAARDSHVTPVGRMLGLQLMAQAIETELGGGIRAFNHVLELILDLLCGVALVVIHQRFRLFWALVISLVAIPVLCLIGSLAAFSTMARWLNFAPVVLGVLIHQLYDHAREYARMHVQLAELKARPHHPAAADEASDYVI